MAAHALLSPSSASRWLACTPSAQLESTFPDTAGEAAAEGTLAHSLGELLIKGKLHRLFSLDVEKAQFDYGVIQADKFYNEAMQEHCQNYAAFVLEQFAEAQNITPDAKLFLEQKLDLTDYIPDGFGTGDCVIIADGTLQIIDLKYGKGVPVSAKENKQMMLYALGALAAFEHLYDVARVKMTIYQPRLDNISHYILTVDELQQFGNEVLKPLALLASKGEGDFQPGDHCRFCKVKAQCRALADHNLAIAKYEFAMPALLGDEEIADILNRIDGLTQWAKSVEDYALSEAVNNGKKWPGYKLVEGRSNRTISDEKAVIKALSADCLPTLYMAEPKLLGITALEKNIGKAKFSKLVAPYLIKPPGKLTLVPESSEKPEYHSADGAKADFALVLESDN